PPRAPRAISTVRPRVTGRPGMSSARMRWLISRSSNRYAYASTRTSAISAQMIADFNALEKCRLNSERPTTTASTAAIILFSAPPRSGGINSDHKSGLCCATAAIAAIARTASNIQVRGRTDSVMEHRKSVAKAEKAKGTRLRGGRLERFRGRLWICGLDRRSGFSKRRKRRHHALGREGNQNLGADPQLRFERECAAVQVD